MDGHPSKHDYSYAEHARIMLCPGFSRILRPHASLVGISKRVVQLRRRSSRAHCHRLASHRDAKVDKSSGGLSKGPVHGMTIGWKTRKQMLFPTK